MPRFLRIVLRIVAFGVLGLIALATVSYFVRNPEHTTLDSASRTGASGKFVKLADGFTHYDVSGPDSGRAVVLVHGASVPYYIWDSTAVALSAAGFRVVRYDRFGFGLSDSTMFTRQINELADSL